MKKSKILAPALALTIFSTAAAVTGTVAWYFAQRAVSIQATVTSFNPESGLKVTLTEGVGTHVEDDEKVSEKVGDPAIVSHDLIRDGSVDLENEKAYSVNLNRAGTGVASYNEIDAKSNEDELYAGTTEADDPADEEDYYYATKYTAKFELVNHSDTRKSGLEYALYYDNSLLGHGTDASSIQESLRIGFVFDRDLNLSDDVHDYDYFVIAPFRKAVPAEGIKYVKSELASAPKGDYDVDGKVIYGFETKLTEKKDSQNNVLVDEFDNPYYTAETIDADPADNLAGLDGSVPAANVGNYKGYICNLKGEDFINVTVYTWFEGEDPHSASNYIDEIGVQTNLGFSILEVK